MTAVIGRALAIAGTAALCTALALAVLIATGAAA